MSDIYRTAPVPTPAESYEIGRAHGAQAGRERIIKLLEALDCEANGVEHDCNPLDEYTIKDLIELIKGEQK